MRRLSIIALAAIAAAISGLTGSDSASPYRVEAVFDTAKGMVSGQNVKVAGTKVGTIEAVALEPRPNGGYKARMTMSVERASAPFRDDATCAILPEGLISESFVECDPGSPDRAELEPDQSGTPTVGLKRTSVPASLQDVLNIFSLPTPDQLRVLLNELGIGTAARGEDINALLRRANPALGQARRVLGVLNRERDQLVAATEQTDEVLAELASRDEDVRRFVDRAAAVARTTAAHRQKLGEGVERLPAMLDALEGSLGPVRRATRAGLPLLDDLRDAAPALSKLNSTLPAFIEPALPALHALGDASAAGRKAIPPALPVVSSISKLSRVAGPASELLEEFLVDSRDRGGFEGLGHFLYGLPISTSAYDNTSHFATIINALFPGCMLANMQPGTDVVPGCSHAYTAPGRGQIPTTLDAGVVPPANAGRAWKRKQVKSILDYLLK